MIFFVTKDKKKCDFCAGFGEFNMSYHPVTLTSCRHCQSIHPEQYGLRYEKVGDNYHFYLIESKLLDWILK